MTNKKTHFGYSEIDASQKAGKVASVFHSVASNYDLMNDLMSFGMHHIWKKFLVDTSNAKKDARILDIAGGTADLSILLAKKIGAQSSDFKGQMIHSDINLSMLNIGRDKLINQGIFIPSVLCDAESLPFPDNYFDYVTIGFGIRNMTDKKKALKEIYRVLSPGGKILILEFSKIWKPLQFFYDQFSFKLLPKLGKLFAKDESSYQYLVESIRMHPDQESLKKMMEEESFSKVEYLNLSSGVVAIHMGYKF
jgi:demethylmenaquinone methyltransferase/2-methoxy-6-polyprenyl-1,4-benzoquinol methylase